MSQFFKGAALFVAVTFVIWVAVLWHWQTTSRDMTIADIVAYLGILPLVVFALLIGLRWAWRGAQPRREAALRHAAARQAPPVDAAAAAAQASDAQERHAVVHLLAAHVACAAGMTAAELVAAATDNEPRPEFDDALRDADGLPVLCARMRDLQPEAVAEALETIAVAQRRQRAEWAAFEVGEPAQRALAALAEPLQELTRDLGTWAVAPAAAARDLAPARALPGERTATAPLVRVLFGMPPTWTDFERSVAEEWLRLQLAAQGVVPLARFVFAAHAGSGEDLWLKADQLLLNLAREGRRDLVLVAACHSDVADAAVDVLEREQRLFSAQHRPKGVMPGEAAATLLLAGAGWVIDAQAEPAPVRLHRPAVARRDKSIELVPGRVGNQSLDDVATHALAAAQIDAAALTDMVCDADQHTPRGTELFGTTLALLPQLDPGEDMRLLGTVTGYVGAANVLLVLAAAAERVRACGAPCLALCVGDPFMRLGALVRPGAERDT